jgi:hypothetical protein
MFNTNWQDVLLGLEVSGLGLVGVFSALILFYIIVVLLDRIKEKPSEEGTEE